MIMACIMMSPFRMWCRANFTYFSITRTWEFLAQCGIPCTVILYLSYDVYKRLKILSRSEEFKDDQNEALRKSVAKARLTLSMNMIFVTCEFLFWIRLPIDVRYIPKLNWLSNLAISYFSRSSNGIPISTFGKLGTGVQSWLSLGKQLFLAIAVPTFGSTSTYNGRTKRSLKSQLH